MVLEAEEAHICDQLAEEGVDLDKESEFEGVAAPQVLVRAVRTVDELRSVIRQVSPRWRLDALSALDHYLP